MTKPKFDPNAAFRNIVGVTEENEQMKNETENPAVAVQGKETVFIEGNIVKEETRSKRVNLVVKPSVYSTAKKKCEALNISLNECINQFLEKWGKE